MFILQPLLPMAVGLIGEPGLLAVSPVDRAPGLTPGVFI